MVARLAFQPQLHGFHFPNEFRSNYTGGPLGSVTTDGLCGGMVLAAFNYFRYGLPIPPHHGSDIDFNVNFEILRTVPGTTNLVDYIFHSQVATFENASIFAFIGSDPNFDDEFRKVRARIDQGQYLILGLKLRPGVAGLGHQVLCYGYDPDTQAIFVYDPNFPDEEVTITRQPVGNESFIHLRGNSTGRTDERYRVMFEQQELLPDRVSDRVTYDMPDNIARNLNFSVRPPLVNMQEGWRWCRKCEGMWFGLDPAVSCCPAGGQHTHEGSGLYQLPMDYRASSGQYAWRWCQKCQGLFFGGHYMSAGACPEGGQHDGKASADYTMIYGTSGNADWTQNNWRWCDKCQGMHYGVGGICPAGGAHNPSRSAHYVMLMTT